VLLTPNTMLLNVLSTRNPHRCCAQAGTGATAAPTELTKYKMQLEYAQRQASYVQDMLDCLKPCCRVSHEQSKMLPPAWYP
jgi:hypothetical protein